MQPVGRAYLGLHAEFAWLRAAVRHQLPGTYAPGKRVEDRLRTMMGTTALEARDLCPRQTRSTRSPKTSSHSCTQEQIYRAFPHEALVRIENVTHKANGAVKRSDTVYPGSCVRITAPEGTMAHDQILPIAVGMAVETSSQQGPLVVAWYSPDMGPGGDVQGRRQQ